MLHAPMFQQGPLHPKTLSIFLLSIGSAFFKHSNSFASEFKYYGVHSMVYWLSSTSRSPNFLLDYSSILLILWTCKGLNGHVCVMLKEGCGLGLWGGLGWEIWEGRFVGLDVLCVCVCVCVYVCVCMHT